MNNPPDAETLDRIDIRYDVHVNANVDIGSVVYPASARVLITCGTYSGISDKRIIADLVSSRGIQPEDILPATQIHPYPESGAIADALNERGIRERDIAEFRIDAVLVDEREVAVSDFAPSSQTAAG